LFQAQTICKDLDQLRSVRALVKASEVLEYQRFYRNSADGTWIVEYSCIVSEAPNDIDDLPEGFVSDGGLKEGNESNEWRDELNSDYSNSRGV
jgi:hypothetical protein